MASKDPIAEKLPSNADHAVPAPWAQARGLLAEGDRYWLATVRPDGRPQSSLASARMRRLARRAGASSRNKKTTVRCLQNRILEQNRLGC